MLSRSPTPTNSEDASSRIPMSGREETVTMNEEEANKQIRNKLVENILLIDRDNIRYFLDWIQSVFIVILSRMK